MISLAKVPLQKPCSVVSLNEGETSTKLMEMGIVPGIELEVLFTAPGGCPIAVLVGGEYILALRKEEADLVTVYLTKHTIP